MSHYFTRRARSIMPFVASIMQSSTCCILVSDKSDEYEVKLTMHRQREQQG